MASSLQPIVILLTLLVRTTLSVVAVVAAIVIASLIYFRYSRNKTYHLMKAFPGTFEEIPLARHLRLHWSLLRSANDTGLSYGVFLYQAMQSMAVIWQQRKVGAIASYVAGRPSLILFRADHVEELLMHPTNLRKTFGYDFTAPWLGRSILLATGDAWRARRKLLTPAFHFRILEEFNATMNTHARTFAHRLLSAEHGGRIDDLVPLIAALTLDIVCETAMGTSMHCQTSDTGRQYLRGIGRLGELVIARVQTLHHWSDFVYRRSRAGREFYAILSSVHGFTWKVIEDRKTELLTKRSQEAPDSSDSSQADAAGPSAATRRRPTDFLDLMLQRHLDGEMTLDDVRSEADTFMFAGHDTTSMALTHVIYLIGLHADVQSKLQQEIDEVIGELDLDNDDILPEHVRSLKYMDAVIKESQRIYPSVPIIGRVLDYDMQIDGKTVPRGTDVVIALFGLHRDPDVFPRPDEFLPERFFTESAKRSPFAFVPFSGGPRNCIGQRFALLEEKITLCHLLARYNWRSMNPRDEMQHESAIVLRPKIKIRMQFRLRTGKHTRSGLKRAAKNT